MWSILLCALLASPAAPPTAAEINRIAAQAQTGTLIFSEGDCLAVKVFSQSSYTHVAMAVVQDGSAWVYDAMPGTGVRKTPLNVYLQGLVPGDVHVLHPVRPFDEMTSQRLRSHLHSQLGRPYRVHHHATGQRTDGLHCAEYLTDALIVAERLTAHRPSRVSPGSLLEGVVASGVYADGGRRQFLEAPPVVPEGETWCERQCRESSECCTAICEQLSRWFLCRSK